MDYISINTLNNIGKKHEIIIKSEVQCDGLVTENTHMSSYTRDFNVFVTGELQVIKFSASGFLWSVSPLMRRAFFLFPKENNFWDLFWSV